MIWLLLDAAGWNGREGTAEESTFLFTRAARMDAGRNNGRVCIK